MLHPATPILAWCLLVTAAQHFPLLALLLLTSAILLFSLHFSSGKLRQLLRRTRWLLLSLLLVYAYNTPGVAVIPALDNFSPTQEGLQEGLLQLGRLLLALSSLAVLLDKLSRTQWMAGIHSLLLPLHWLGLARERFTVRLVLTLHYAEAAMLRGNRRWQDILQELGHAPAEHAATALHLPQTAFGWRDAALLGGASLLWWLRA